MVKFSDFILESGCSYKQNAFDINLNIKEPINGSVNCYMPDYFVESGMHVS